MIEQWDRVSTTAGNAKDITFSLEFTQVPSFVAISNSSISSSGISQGVWTESHCGSKTSAKVYTRGYSSGEAGTVSWIAIGY